MATVKVKMKTTAAGPDGVLMAGSVVTVDEDFGETLVAGGYATDEKPTAPSPPTDGPVEAAVVEPPEKAARTGKIRGKPKSTKEKKE